MEKYILFFFSFVVIVSIVGIIWFINPSTSSLGTYSAGERPGFAVNVLTKERIIKPSSGDGVPRQTVLRKGALESTGGSACPSDYRLATKTECRFVPCIPVAEDYQGINPGKFCKPIVGISPSYPEPVLK